ncbi:MAG: hypothetical protein WBI53_11040 [Paludibacter sp.]
MKTSIFKMSGSAYIIAGIIMIFSLNSLSSCAAKTSFLTSTIAPAAQGTVTVKQDGNKNYVIKVKISNLAPSNRLTPPMNAYIVWMVATDNSTKNLGQLNTSEKFMSKNLNASFETVSGIKPVKIFITSENEVNAQYPESSTLVLTTDYLK